MKRRYTLALLIFHINILAVCGVFAQKSEQVSSPNGNLSAKVIIGERIYYQVKYKNETVLMTSPMSMTIDNRILGKNAKLKKAERTNVNNIIQTVWGSRKIIDDRYNELRLDFEGDFSVLFRVYDHALAYRFITNLKEKKVIVQDEEVAYRFNFGTQAWVSERQDYETRYKKVNLDVEKINEFGNKMNKLYLPVVVQSTPATKMLITEADLRDYPSLFLNRGNDYENYLLGTFEKAALTTKTGGFSNYSQLADQTADYIAETSGKRSYPWRLMVISDNDRIFADNDFVYQLSEPCKLAETDWIKPGKAAWEWWHDYAVKGVEFVGGVNTETYCHHIDFAATYGLEYILIDWLWTDKYDLTLVNPDVDIHAVINYASVKGVKVLLWCPGHTLHRQLDIALQLFSQWGAAGVKADFFGREDQSGIRMYEDIAAAAAKYRLLVDFHGCTKPAGLSRTYPNIINYEAVLGNEYNKLEALCDVNHKVMIPFVRGQIGPMDYTPGGMRNVHRMPEISFTLPSVSGTRANEAALFVIYNEALKMMCDAPFAYEEEPEYTRFISQIPTTWDETRVLDARFGEYLLLARRTGDNWYIAGITDENSRSFEIDLSFLEASATFPATILKDGVNTGRIASDYVLQALSVNPDKKLSINMSSGGGFVVRLNKNN
ncbi:MAG: glycoside hydrolase family 97 protein [Candidatus Symbiothrix sp.]|jgi:alpha-glucosidase|nr:glycoside hydrolase family 97 protein [Candidatus Symbiothrix sp.]